MSGEKIDVDKGILENKIKELKNLHNDIENNNSNHEIQGSGYTKRFMEIVDSGFKGIENTVDYLICNTISLLENIKDGYIEIDENTAAEIGEFTKKVVQG